MEQEKGLVCPGCACRHFYTTHTYKTQITFKGKKYGGIRRRKVCRHCGRSQFTVEVDEEPLEREQQTIVETGRGLPQKDNPPPNPFL